MATIKQLHVGQVVYLKKISTRAIRHGCKVQILRLPVAQYKAIGRSAGYGSKSAYIQPLEIGEACPFWAPLSKLSVDPV